MTADAIIAEIKALPKSELSKVFAYIDERRDADDFEVPESLKMSMAQALSGQTVDLDRVLSGEPPRSKK